MSRSQEVVTVLGTLIWILAVVLVIMGLLSLIRGSIIWGLLLIIIGVVIGPGTNLLAVGSGGMHLLGG